MLRATQLLGREAIKKNISFISVANIVRAAHKCMTLIVVTLFKKFNLIFNYIWKQFEV
jgi:hypothetical protein